MHKIEVKNHPPILTWMGLDSLLLSYALLISSRKAYFGDSLLI